MAKPSTANATKLQIMMGNGATPEVFLTYCALTTKSIRFTTQTNEVYVPDCDNPDDPAWREITKAGRAVTVTGQGVMDMINAFGRYRAAYDNELSSNYRILINLSAALGGGYWVGAFMLTEFEVGASDGEKINANITLESDGPVVWVPTP